MKKILSMFLACVVFFAQMDVMVKAANVENIPEMEVRVSESEETSEQDIAHIETVSDETGDDTSAEEVVEGEDDELGTSEEIENQESGGNSEQESEPVDEEEKEEENIGDEDVQERIEEEINEESIKVEEDGLSENDLEENVLQSISEGIGEYAVRSTDSVNSAITDYIYSFQSSYPEGSVWNSSYDGGKQCFGFAMLIADKVFECHPKNTSIRNASNGAVSNGWTCYYVNANNCNSLAVEPGDIIDSPTKATSSHTAMVLSVSGSSITCVQCNLSGNCKVYWTQKFNYNSQNASLAQIYSRFGSYGTIRLWKPSESMKEAVTGSNPVLDTEAPYIGPVTVYNENGVMTYSCTATDNVGVSSAWAMVSSQNTTKRYEAGISGNQIRGQWPAGAVGTSGTISVTVYVQDAAGNTASNSTSINMDQEVIISPRDISIEVGEKETITATIIGYYDIDGMDFKARNEDIIKVNSNGLQTEIEGLTPGTDICDYSYYSTLLNPDGSVFQPAVTGYAFGIATYVHVVPNTPKLTSITNIDYKHDYIEYIPVEYAETYDLYRLIEGEDTDYQLVGTFEENETNSITVEHPSNGTTYYYKITAKAAQKNDITKDPIESYYPTSRFSNVLTSTSSSFTPENLTAVSNWDNEIDLVWDAVDDASGYEIYRYIEDDNKELLAVRKSSQTGFKDIDVDGGVTYSYDVYATDITGEKGMEATVSCTAKGFHEEKIFYVVSFHTGFDTILIDNENVEKGQCSRSLETSYELMQMDGYEFVGWYTKPDGAGERYTSETKIMSDTILYAFWKEKAEDKSEKFWVAPIGDQKYTGKAIKPEIKVFDGNTLLIQGIDYTVSYKNNVKVCDAQNASLSKIPAVIVKGKKNYSDRVTIPFSIVAIDLNDSNITVEDMIAEYTGKELKPVPVIWHNGKKLKYKTDYIVMYSGPLKSIGRYTIEVIGKGGYTGKRDVSYTITNKLLLDKVKIRKIPNQIYTGKMLRPAFTVKYGNTLLKEDSAHDGSGDYSVRYINNRNIGTATIVLDAVEESAYVGSKTITFNITGTSINKISVSPIKSYTYSGEEIKPQIKLTDKMKSGDGSNEAVLLREGCDYTLSYSNNINVGTAKVLIQGKGKYTGRKIVTFRIIPYDLSKLPAKISSESQQVGYYILVNDGRPVAYQKGNTRPSVTVNYSDYTTDDKSILKTHVLSEEDYKVVYKNVSAISSSNISKPQIIIQGKGNYKGTITSDSAKFEIVKADLDVVTAKATDVSYRFKQGNFAATKVSLYDVNGKKLTAGTDYNRNFTYYNVTDYFVASSGMDPQKITSCELKTYDKDDFELELEKAETGVSQKITKLDTKNDVLTAYQIICVRISAANTDKCNYTGMTYALYRISTIDIGKCKVKVNSSFTYNGTELIMDDNDLIVTMGSGKSKQELVYGRDFLFDEESYTNNVKVGTAKVQIYGIGKYCGSKQISFRIRAKKFAFIN